MESQSPSSKRKRINGLIGDLLEAGEWRGAKRSRTPSPSRSPPASGVPTVDTGSPNSNTQSQQYHDSGCTRDTNPGLQQNAPTLTPPSVSPNPSNMTMGGKTSALGTTSTAWTGLEKTLQALRITTKMCPPLRSAIDDLMSCLPNFETAAKSRRDYEDLATGLKTMVGLLIPHFEDDASENITNTIANIAKAIRREIELIGNRQSRDGGEASLCTWSISTKHYVNTQLEGLHPAKLARYDSELSTDVSRRTCTENTRTEILWNLHQWAEDQDKAKIYWMNGMAGTGKTTIACSMCVELETSKQLAASFFCTRISPECRDAKRIVPTIAYQLARRLTPFRSVLCRVLEEYPDIGTGTISDQFACLLKKPLMNVKDNMPNNLVFVIDALDECDDPYIVELFLGLLFRSASDLPIKFFVTSRPEPAIRQRMISESERSRSILYLHEIERSLVQADIELYLREELSFMSPTNADMKQLAVRAGNLFIYAATAARYIRPPGRSVDSRGRLEIILAANTESNKSLLPIDRLYSLILTTAIEDEELEPQEQERMRTVLWTVVCACEPVLINTVAAISGIQSKVQAIAALEPLRSVLHVADHSEIVTTLHASFPDYILSPERSGRFACNVSVHNRLLSEQCFEIMKAQLRFNICEIQSSFIPDDQILGLEERIATNISEELFYACRFWMDHLNHLTPDNENLGMFQPIFFTLTNFLSHQLLFWMEVLNLKKCMFIGVAGTSKLIAWVNLVAVGHSILRDLAFDAQCFVAGYASRPISNYTPHIYLSALPFTPFLPTYLLRFRGLVKVSGSALNEINPAALATWESAFPVHSIAFLPKGEHIAFGNQGGELSVRNAHDGKHVFRPFKAHEKPITCVGVSSDGSQIATGSSDMTLSVWSVQNGALISGPFKGHTDTIESVAFSPDGTHIASGSEDHTVGIWISQDAFTPMKQLKGHRYAVKSVAFSPNGVHVVSVSSDHTIRVWNIYRGTQTFTTKRLEEPIVIAQFLPDGSNIFSFSLGSPKSPLRVWNSSTGSLLREQFIVENSPKTPPVAVSPSGNFLAGTSRDASICIWSTHTNALINKPFRGHTQAVKAISFSDDDTRVISASEDRTIRLWNIYSRSHRAETAAESLATISKFVAMTPNQTHAAFADLVKARTSIQVLDLNTYTSRSIDVTDLDYRMGRVKLVQISLDGTRIFSIYSSGIVCTWDLHTASRIDGPHHCSTTGGFHSAACSFDGRSIVTSYIAPTGGSERTPRSVDRESTVTPYTRVEFEIWDVRLNRRVALHSLEHTAVVFSQLGRRFFTNTIGERGDVVNVWDAHYGTHVAGPYHGMRGLSISPDGTHLVYFSPSPGELQLVNVDTSVTTHIPLEEASYGYSGLEDYVSAVFSPDGSYLAYTVGGNCYVWSMRDNSVVRALNFAEKYLVLKWIAYSSNGWCTISTEDGFRLWRFHVDSPRFSVRPDGWLIDSQSRPLIWVPPEIQTIFPMQSGIVLRNNDLLRVEYDNAFLGDDWSKCYLGN